MQVKESFGGGGRMRSTERYVSRGSDTGVPISNSSSACQEVNHRIACVAASSVWIAGGGRDHGRRSDGESIERPYCTYTDIDL